MDELEAELKLKSSHAKPRIIRNYVGGNCTYCGEIPTKKVVYDVGDGDKLVEWYCDKCFERWVEKEKEIEYPIDSQFLQKSIYRKTKQKTLFNYPGT